MLSLIKTQILVNFNLNPVLKDKKRVKNILIGILLIIAFLPSYISYIALMYLNYKNIAKTGLDIYDLYTSGIYVGIQSMLLLFGFIIVYQILFYSNDFDILLPLPYKPFEIFTAKILIIYLFDLIITIFMALPVYILNLKFAKQDLFIAINSFITILFLPIIPLFLSAVLSILVANMPKIGRSQWFWNIALFVVIISVYLLFVYYLVPTEKHTNITSFSQYKITQIGKLKSVIPGIAYGVDTFIYSGSKGFISQMLNIAVCIIYLAVLYIFSSKFYLSPIIKGQTQSRTSKREYTVITTQSFIKSYIKKEIFVTTREPMVMMNGIGGYIAIPILLVMYYILGQKSQEVDIIGTLSKVFQNNNLKTYIYMAVPVALATFSISSLYSASYSKDGKKLWIEKSLPILAEDIFLGKLIANTIIISIPNILSYILINLIILKINLLDSIIILLISEIIVTFNGLIGLIIDVIRPKLIWKNVTEAVKQNMNVILQMFILFAHILLNALFVYLAYKYNFSRNLGYLILLSTNIILLIAAYYAGLKISKRFNSINV
ncbi:hypothetical protein ACAG39_11810 [Caldicellulosiruptoraceae bacterium PP1]